MFVTLKQRLQRLSVPFQVRSETLICVPIDGQTADLLRRHLQTDIREKGLKRGPYPFSMFDLMDMHQLLPGATGNVIMSHRQRMLMASYAQYLFLRATCFKQQEQLAYDALLDTLLPPQDTQITFSWPSVIRF